MLGTGRARVEHLRLFIARQNPLPWQSPTSGKRRMCSVPTSCRTASTASTSNGEALQNRQDRLKNPLQGAYAQEKGRKRNSKRVHFVLPFCIFREKNTLVPVPYSTEASKAGRS